MANDPLRKLDGLPDRQPTLAVGARLFYIMVLALTFFLAATAWGCSSTTTPDDSVQPGATGSTGSGSMPSGTYSPGGSFDTGAVTDTHGEGGDDSTHAGGPSGDADWQIKARDLITQAIEAIVDAEAKRKLKSARASVGTDEPELALSYLRTVMAMHPHVAVVRDAARVVGTEATKRRRGE